MTQKIIKIGISSCLLGNKVRYDGEDKYNATIIEQLGQQFELIPFCPELEIGMGVPRDPMQLEWLNGQIRCVDIEDHSKDMTDKLVDCANQQLHWQKDICGYIFKKNSPSCGTKHVKVVKDGTYERTGTGIYARQLMKNFPALPVEEEDRMEDPSLRETFIARVKAYTNT